MSLDGPLASDNSCPVLEHGTGVHLFTEDGRRLLDFASGGTAPLGHGFAGGAHALHVPEALAYAAQLGLAARLTEISFADHVRFASSAEQAGELAICAMWKYQDMNGRPKRRRIVTFEGGFHGHSPLLGLAVGDSTFARALDPLGGRFDRATFNDLASVHAAVGPQTAGILVEPLQRKGTFEPPQNGFLMGLRSIADEYDLVLAYDEAQCGIGRTGALWAHEWSGAPPDLMVLGNNLAGGLSFGALLTTARMAKILGPGTEPGHPLAIAHAHELLDLLLAPGFLQAIEALSWSFEEQLYWLRRNHEAVIEAQYGVGLWQALKLRVPAALLQQKLIERGLVTIAGRGDVLGLVPALTVTESEIKDAVALLASACESISAAA